MPASVRVHRWRGVAAVTLTSGELKATFVPEMNLLGASLRLGGEEFLALPGGVGAYRRVRTTGLPLLAPWANRLSARAYRAGPIRVDLDRLDLYTDPNGLPIHGTMSAQEPWDVLALDAGGRVARLRAGFESCVRRLRLGDRRHARVGMRERVDPRLPQRLELAAADGEELVRPTQRFARWWVTGFASRLLRLHPKPLRSW